MPADGCVQVCACMNRTSQCPAIILPVLVIKLTFFLLLPWGPCSKPGEDGSINSTVPMESSSFDSMTLDEAKAQKKRLTQRIKAFDAEFKELHGRDPTKEDYEISGLRADFDKYELARQRIAELRQLAKQSQVMTRAIGAKLIRKTLSGKRMWCSKSLLLAGALAGITSLSVLAQQANTEL